MLRYDYNVSSLVMAEAGHLGYVATQTFLHGLSHSLFGQANEFHTYTLIVGIAFFLAFVSMAPFVLGSSTSIMKLVGIPVLLLILGRDSTFLPC